MVQLPVHKAMARLFVREGVEVVVALMGNGNMHWVCAMSDQPNVRTIHVRHEHCACGMAVGYAVATGRVGVASVTSGPGFTQIATILTTASRSRVPLVIMAGEVSLSPSDPKEYSQSFDQALLAQATGAAYIPLHSARRLADCVRESFYRAKTERRPVILGVPQDLQKEIVAFDDCYEPSEAFVPRLGRIGPDAEIVRQIAEKLSSARDPVIIAGRGVILSGAAAAVEGLAEQCGALLATTLPARGLFDGNPRSLGVAGGFAMTAAREKLAGADLVLAVGASISAYTSDSGHLYPNAFVIQVDQEPAGLRHGIRLAHLWLKGDAKLSVEAIARQLPAGGGGVGSARSAGADNHFQAPMEGREPEAPDDVLDPYAFIAELDEVIPKGWDIVSGSGHCAYFHAHMRGRVPGRYHVVREFGAIGNALSIGMGVAVARNDGKVVIIDGDGGLMMHLQELETIARCNLQVLIVVMNDGGYGAEYHKLRAQGMDDRKAMFGRPDLAGVANALRISGATITAPGELQRHFDDYTSSGKASLWNVHISDRVVAPSMKSSIGRKGPLASA